MHIATRARSVLLEEKSFLWNSLIPPPFLPSLRMRCSLRFFFIRSAMPLLSSQTSVESPSWSLYFNVACESAVMYQSGKTYQEWISVSRALTLAWWLAWLWRYCVWAEAFWHSWRMKRINFITKITKAWKLLSLSLLWMNEYSYSNS